MTGRVALLAMVAVTAVLAACGGGGGGGTTALPGPTPSPSASASPVTGNATLSVSLSGVSATASSIVVRFNGAAAAPIAVPAGCAGGSCTITLAAPAGSNQPVVITTYQGSNGTGAALQAAAATVSLFTGQTTSVNAALHGIMATYTVSLSPSTVTMGMTATAAIQINAFDATGAPISGTPVTASGTAPSFNVADSDTSGSTVLLTSANSLPSINYSGLGSAPATFTVTSTGYASASASLAYAPAPPATIVLAATTATTPSAIEEYGPSGGVVRRYSAPQYYGSAGLRFDANGTLWTSRLTPGTGLQGFKSDATSAGTMDLPGQLLSFDLAGHVYAADNTLNSVNAIHEYAVGAGNALTEVRMIVTPGTIVSAAEDAAGNVYAGFNDAVREYPSTGSGQVAPIVTNTGASTVVALDPNGNVFAAVTPTIIGEEPIGEWPAGTFSPGPPARSFNVQALGLYDLAADAASTAYVVARIGHDTFALFAAPANASQASQSGNGGGGAVAAPLR